MCFSAGASFSAGALLAITGAVSLQETKERPQRLFAAIPLLFATQQICEGFLWLSLNHSWSPYWRSLFTYLFLFFAQVVWTTWIPYSCYLLEESHRRKKALFFVSSVGLGCSCLLACRLMIYDLSVQNNGRHIQYDITSPEIIIVISSILYFIATIFPLLICSVRGTRALGLLLVVSLVVTRIFYDAYFISVWCFFAALLSIIIVYIIKELNVVTFSSQGRTQDRAS